MKEFDTITKLSESMKSIGINPSNIAAPIWELPYAKQENEYKHYKKDIDKYHSQSVTLTNDEINLLIMSIDNGYATYKKLKELVPRLNSPTLCEYLTCPPPFKIEPPPLSMDHYYIRPNTSFSFFTFSNPPNDYYLPYEFKDSDTFYLSTEGKNELSNLKKQASLDDIAEKNLNAALRSAESSADAAKYAKISILVAVLSIVISVILHYI